jgi:hypothetical protein
MDLSKLTPAPWAWTDKIGWSGLVHEDSLFMFATCAEHPPSKMIHHGRIEFDKQADKDFIVLARQAFEVMMRRQWGVGVQEDGFFVTSILGLCHLSDTHAKFVEYAMVGKPDPFTALIEADEWYKKHIENQ